jgi:hypothetical protein
MNDFGIVIACYHKDYRFAKACCASIRYFLGNVPICLLVDGSFSVSDLIRSYHISALYPADIRNPFLRTRSFGYGLTKMIAFWESPFQYFLYLDADTVVCGDILKHADFSEFDIIADDTQFRHLNNWRINKSFFDVDQIETIIPDFKWKLFRHKYFISGVYFAKRGLFDIEEYMKLLDLKAQYNGLFKFGEQGILNFMIFQQVQQQNIRFKNEELQIFGSDIISNKILRKRFEISLSHGTISSMNDSVIIHWAGSVNSPYYFRADLFVQPMTHFRERFLLDSSSIYSFLPIIKIQFEDTLPALIFLIQTIKSKLRKCFIFLQSFQRRVIQ